jgi:hypothetical protein
MCVQKSVQRVTGWKYFTVLLVHEKSLFFNHQFVKTSRYCIFAHYWTIQNVLKLTITPKSSRYSNSNHSSVTEVDNFFIVAYLLESEAPPVMYDTFINH